MTKEQIDLVKLGNDRIPPEEMERLRNLVADTKRFVEMYSILPYMREELDADFEGFLKKHGLNVDPDDMKLICYEEFEEERERIRKSKNQMELLPEAAFHFNLFLANKLLFRDRMIGELCKPSNKKMARWRERQSNRCLAGIGGINKSFVHSPFTVELDLGCSVGCEFCGLSAGKLSKICRHTDENAALFQGIIKAAHKVIGDAAGFGTLYLATEPLDNPDYEQYEADYFAEFGFIPQITTAVADRDIERTRRFVAELSDKPGYIHRFSLRSLEMAEKIFEAFTPLELLRVELLPQFPEAPSFVNFTVVGAQSKHVAEEDIDEMDPGTICCADGFAVNMAERSIRLITPCHRTEKFVNGIAEPCKKTFETAEEFEQILQEMIDDYMVIDLPSDEPLKLYPYLKRTTTEYGDSLKSIHGGSIFALDKIKEDYSKRVIELLMEGTHDKHEIVQTIEHEYNEDAAEVFWLLNQFWKQGYIYDSRLFD